MVEPNVNPVEPVFALGAPNRLDCVLAGSVVAGVVVLPKSDAGAVVGAGVVEGGAAGVVEGPPNKYFLSAAAGAPKTEAASVAPLAAAGVLGGSLSEKEGASPPNVYFLFGCSSASSESALRFLEAVSCLSTVVLGAPNNVDVAAGLSPLVAPKRDVVGLSLLVPNREPAGLSVLAPNRELVCGCVLGVVELGPPKSDLVWLSDAAASAGGLPNGVVDVSRTETSPGGLPNGVVEARPGVLDPKRLDVGGVAPDASGSLD